MNRRRGNGAARRDHRLIGFLFCARGVPAARTNRAAHQSESVFLTRPPTPIRATILEADTGLIYSDNVTRVRNGSGIRSPCSAW